MKRVLLLVVVAGLTFLVILFATKPELLNDIWIWAIGLSGLIIKGFQSIIEYFKGLFDGDESKSQAVAPSEPDTFSGNKLKLLRVSDDGDTTIGMLYVNDQFYCYTLEDTGKRTDNPAEVRIPAGSYPISFSKQNDEMTLSYRAKYPSWFGKHLQLSQVPKHDAVYIHHGGSHRDTTQGCILVSDSIQAIGTDTELTNSMLTFQRLYQFVSQQLAAGTAHRISIYDEQWINQLTQTK